MLRILKFGGSSLYDIHRITNAVAIVNKQRIDSETVVVVSALGGVTDELISLMALAMKPESGWRDRFDLLCKRHHSTLGALDVTCAGEQVRNIKGLLMELENDLAGLEALAGQNNASARQPANTPSSPKPDRSPSAQQQETAPFSPKPGYALHPRQSDRILSFGERLSSHIFAAALIASGTPAKAFESHKLVRTNDRFGDADVDTTATTQLVRDALHPVKDLVPVVTGFIGATSENEITTLGRSGSDYTASILGEALDAQEVQIWTDVNGVLTADPDIVPTAMTIPQLHYSEVAEMAHFGAKVLHPRTVLPLEARNIPIRIKNTMQPDISGTVITREYQPTSGRLRSVSVKKNIMVIALRSKGLDKIHEFSYRALRALKQNNIPVLFHAAASSDYGITLVVPSTQSDQARQALMDEFRAGYESGMIDELNVLDQISMVTVIGEKLERDLGISGAVLSVLGENGIAPLALAKGLANRHLSLLLKNREAEMAVRLLNDHFCIHPHRIRLFLAGLGAVGGKLLELLEKLVDPVAELSIIGACDTDKMAWHPSGIPPGMVTERVGGGQKTDWPFIINHLAKEYPYRTVFIDATGDPDVARKYPLLLKSGIHVVTPGKRANSFEQVFFDELMDYTVNKSTHYLFEATVGAGMPVLQTIKDLLRSGDVIRSISGAVSGTMTYLFAELEKGIPFDEIIRTAKREGITEPDPRDDLSGEDVARKFMILARASGFRVEREDIVVEDLTPDYLKELPQDHFFEELKKENGIWKERVAHAAKHGEVLRYTGHLDDGRITVGMKAVPQKSPLGALSGTDNLISIRTDRYSGSPLIIQGPGAGKEVTAAGVLADVQKISRRLLK